jgi:5-formyltetrahydrofolate cyclo-ligase
VKVELRKRMRALRNTTPLSVIAAKSGEIVKKLASMREVAQARGVALFWPMVERHEVDLRPLDALLREKGKRVAYASIDQETRQMSFRWVDDVAILAERGFGFAEPPSDAPCAHEGLDAIVVPALALDPAGVRLGYGAGFYDRTLAVIRSETPGLVTIGVAFEFQYVSELPVLPHDQRVGLIVTDSRCDPAVT